MDSHQTDKNVYSIQFDWWIDDAEYSLHSNGIVEEKNTSGWIMMLDTFVQTLKSAK